jgi:hypothetical protein
MAYSKAKLKSSGNRASPCFRPFGIENYMYMLLEEFTVGGAISQLGMVIS